MGDKITLNVEKREATGKQAAKLRREGLVPGVVYGNKFDATNIQLSQQEARGVVARAGRHTPVELKIGAKKTMAVGHSHPYSIEQVGLHPSREATFPSSHVSPASTTPFPQV
jgi:large subunit ribosomal protein L25